jgi:glycerophosphoryl diester phosphodiesterase
MHITRDGALVLIHDSTVDRITNGKGEVHQLTLSQIKKLDAAYYFTKDDRRTFPYRGRGVTIPTVEEMFQEFPTKRMGIEIKDHEQIAADRFCTLIRKYKMQDNVLVSSFRQEAMDAFRSDCPEVATSATTDEVRHFLTLNVFGLTRSLSPRYGSFQIPESVGMRQILTSHFLHSARERNLPVLPWTINEESDLRHVIRMDVYAINTDYPSRLIQILTKERGHPVR